MSRSVLIAAILFSLAAPSALAQATRTWVSGVGDDANPCSRTAPCKTFAGAISKTATGGEISVLDPGGYGSVNITKSLTINGAGTLASILFTGGVNGIIVNGAGITVNLQNLSFNGGSPTSPGLNGIRIIQASRVTIENCQIFNFSNAGILDERTVAGLTVVRNTSIYNSNALTANSPTFGVRVLPSAGVAANSLVIESSNIFGHMFVNSFGVHVSQGGRASISRSTISGNTRGITALGGGQITVTDSDLSGNQIGARSGAGGIVQLSGTTISGSTLNGLELGGGTFVSFGNNNIAGNVGNNGTGMTNIGVQ